ncbi:MAG TPA: preprotein translocase subunit SecG [Patescibacteria group bacterium]|nr:preprotein translocase subunit SecG [Patescibacteria group bacterium]
MANILSILQIFVAFVLTLLILLQVKGVGFGRVWGNSLTAFSRRGLEGFVFKATFVFAGLFILLSVLQLLH